MEDRNYTYVSVSAGTGTSVNQARNMETGQSWRQYVIAGVANFGICSMGYTMGWTSPVNVKLVDLEQSPLDEVASSDDLSRIGSLLTVGGIIGPFIGGFTASKIGRKWALMISAIPLLIGWILVAAAQNVAMIMAGRVSWGVAVGILFTVTPIYCAEIATNETRGALGSFLQVFLTLGILLVYSIGPFVSYSVIAYVGVVLVACFAISFFWLPESPIYYLTKNDSESAADCLVKIRGKSRAGIQAELNLMQADVKASQAKTASLADIFRGSNFKAFYISCALVSFQQLSGINAVLFYMTDIFKVAGSALDPAISSIIIAAIQLVTSLTTPLVVDRLGRRVLLLISSFGTAVALCLLAMYFFLDESGNPIAESIRILPLIALILFFVAYCWGLGPLPWATMGELLPIEVKAIAAPIVTLISAGLTFLVTRFFIPIADVAGMGVPFLICGMCCVISFFFTLFLVPETKGKSFHEIQDILAGRHSKAEKA